jgi:hypothetical protein
MGGAVEMAQEFRPLEKPAVGHPLFEGDAVHELVGGVGFTRTPGPGGPGPTEPEVGIALDETRGDGSLPRPARSRQNEDQDFAV